MRENFRVRNFIAAAACLVGLLALHVACGSNNEASLPGAVYAKGVPVYPDAKYVGSIGGHSSASFGGPSSSESQSWFFKISDPEEEVVAFYKKKLPEAELVKEDDGTQTFTFKPPAAEEGESVQVIVHKNGDLQIHESLKPGKKGE
jgi:hypothetical protein